ncbi:MAG: hypothetical protein CEN88_98 [Candidatus Berkelbacteria bacterium Licking1014_2]|uniref:Small ribosomal subunit protein bS20 n=1 Tax=Candidatus Berkelbacteria bacterium Licking1014_2 TaxID=2017146 RepID=A0A554LWP9_9BACT|nr:MAG: hypothetical protein CEN88_98 [Candidatus Berkelbacteria bacterium Licking1014_2]
MPITKSAKKALRVNRRQHQENLTAKKTLRGVRKLKANKAQSIIDRAAKKAVIHRHKARRLKSRLMKKHG